MSADRTAARRAWALSLTLHVATLAGLTAVAGRPSENAGPVVIDTRAKDGHPVAVVMLDVPAPRPPVAGAQPPPPLPPMPVAQPSMPPPVGPGGVRTVAHTEPPPAAPTVEGPPPSGVARPPPAAPAVSVPPGAVTAFFGVPAVGKSVVFVIDRSATMGLAGRLDRARREVAASLRLLPPSAKFQVVAYHRAAEPLRLAGRGGLLPATPEAVAAAVAALEGLAAEGGTDHVRALGAALALRPDVIYFLTDEDDLTPDVVKAVTRLNRERACIHALCLAPSRGRGETPMQVLARESRGAFKAIGE
jgi:hypothetical protein